MGVEDMKIHNFVILVVEIIISVLCSAMASTSLSSTGIKDTSTAILLRVDQSGNGDFRKIQDAIDAVPFNNSESVFILVKPGTYREKVVVPADKPLITLSGTDAYNTVITWSEGGDIFTSATLSILASDFVGRNLTIQNTFGSSDRAVALRVAGDRASFYACRILSYQDTLLDDVGRHYYRNCYIEGAIDFVCGNALSIYESCHLHSISKEKGTITAQHRGSPGENTGYTFLGCKITGIGTTFLGRPWGAYSRVVFAFTNMSNVVLPQGWDDWEDSSKESTSYYGEYKCYGPGADESQRVKWSHNMSSDEAAPFLTKGVIGGRSWLRPTPTHFKRDSTIVNKVEDDGKD